MWPCYQKDRPGPVQYVYFTVHSVSFTQLTKRTEEFVASLLRGQDPKIADARKDMNVSISRLQDATEYAILGNTQLGLELSIELSENQRRHETMLEAQMLTLDAVKESTEAIQTNTTQIQSDVRRMLLMIEQSRKEPSKQSSSRASGQNKPPSADQVRAYFADHTRFEGMVHPIVEYQKIVDTLIPGTNEWIFDEAAWLEWYRQETGSERILYITGPAGTGKSHIAASIYNHLRTSSNAETCVAHFWFREMIVAFNSFENVLNWLVIEAAEQNDTICARVNALISRDDVSIDYDSWDDILEKVIRPLFSGPTNPRLQIVLDGLDELEWDIGGTRAKKLELFFKTVNTTPELNISLVCTSRPHLWKPSEPGTIELTKENQLPDMKALIWNHLNTDEGLRSLSRRGKESIANTLQEDVDGNYQHILHFCFKKLNDRSVIMRGPDSASIQCLTARVCYSSAAQACPEESERALRFYGADPSVACLSRTGGFNKRPLHVVGLVQPRIVPGRMHLTLQALPGRCSRL